MAPTEETWSMSDFTQSLSGLEGDRERQAQVLDLAYADLQRIARAELNRHRRGETLNTGALVHEAYLKLFDRRAISFENRKHFFATAARAMRQVVIDHARARLAERRGAGAEHVPLDALAGEPLAVEWHAEQIIDIDRALERLAALDPRLAQVVELRFFGGLEVSEIAELLGVSEPTIKRDTRAAKAFLHKELRGASAR
jgi:RNA polymerase sigma factor (TIGR02999 family)